MSKASDSIDTQSNTPEERPLWKNRDYVLLWSGQEISLLGSQISVLALPLLILALTNSPAQAGLLLALRLLPYLLFSLPAGALVDRLDRKRAMVFCNLLRLLLLGSVPLAFAMGLLYVPYLYLVAFAEGSANVLFSLCQISSIPSVAGPTRLEQANAFNEISEASANLFGPSLGAGIIGVARSVLIGSLLGYLADSFSYLLSIISLLLIHKPLQNQKGSVQRRSLWAEIGEGLNFLWWHPVLRLMALLTASVNFLLVQVELAVILLAQQKLHLSVQGIGLIFSAGGVGALFGGLLSSWVSQRLRFGQIAIISVLLWTLGLGLQALALSPLLVGIGQFLQYVAWPLYSVPLISYRMRSAPEGLQGRVNSAFRSLTYGIEPLGAFIGGLLLIQLGSQGLLSWLTLGMLLNLVLVLGTRLKS